MPNILIIHPEEIMGELLERMLATQGFKLYLVQTAAQARSLLEKNRFDLLILDLVLPDADGLDFVREVRLIYPQMAVLVLSGFGEDPTLAHQALQHGAAGYLSKSIPLEELVRVILTLLRST